MVLRSLQEALEGMGSPLKQPSHHTLCQSEDLSAGTPVPKLTRCKRGLETTIRVEKWLFVEQLPSLWLQELQRPPTT